MYAAVLTIPDVQPAPCEFYPYLPDAEDLAGFSGEAVQVCYLCDSPIAELPEGNPHHTGVVLVYFPDTAPQRGAFDAFAHARCVWDGISEGYLESLTIVPTMQDAFAACSTFSARHTR